MMQRLSINDVIARVRSLMTINHRILISLVAFEMIVCVWGVMGLNKKVYYICGRKLDGMWGVILKKV